MKLTGLLIAILLLSGCSTKMATCLTMGDNSNTHSDFGYFYDSATFDINGPVTFSHIPEDMTHNPCVNTPTQGGVS